MHTKRTIKNYRLTLFILLLVLTRSKFCLLLLVCIPTLHRCIKLVHIYLHVPIQPIKFSTLLYAKWNNKTVFLFQYPVFRKRKYNYIITFQFLRSQFWPLVWHSIVTYSAASEMTFYLQQLLLGHRWDDKYIPLYVILLRSTEVFPYLATRCHAV